MLGLHCISGSTYRLGYGRSHYDSLRVEELSLEGSVFINIPSAWLVAARICGALLFFILITMRKFTIRHVMR